MSEPSNGHCGDRAVVSRQDRKVARAVESNPVLLRDLGSCATRRVGLEQMRVP
ncbi:MAG: hypothetical protein AB7L28_17785 [Kofleriaceae bacterium]